MSKPGVSKYGRKPTKFATASLRSPNNQEEMLVLNIHYGIPTSEPDDVRGERVDHIRLMLDNGTHRVSLAQVAAKIIDQMLESETRH
jgi:anti-sigma28 factor (negative regulator of flagellin synthesis)